MAQPRLVAHAVVRNEECWVWYSLRSALPFVDQIFVWDTDSTDHTVSLIKSIRSPKIKFKAVPYTPDETALSQTRQRMLNVTHTDWLMILDGDEVWPEKSLKIITEFIKNRGHRFDSIVVPTLNCVGDIYHVSSPHAGRYQIAGRTGHYNLRFINLNRVKGLYVDNPPGKLQSYQDYRGVKVQDRNPRHIAFLEAPYLHLTHLTRSHERQNETSVFWRAAKRRVELGLPLPQDFVYPQVFTLAAPPGAAFVWEHRSLGYIIKAHLAQPTRALKHLIF